MRRDIANLVIGDDGQAIDTSFTGTIEVRRPDGSLAEQLEVKNGRADGTYREFFEDGAVREFKLYQAGESMGEYWPNGEVAKKESKQGEERIIEWYYPSGKLHKRMVLGASGISPEPVRLFHENGQLAEELSVRRRNPYGPWLKFFEDGSPQLQAEFIDDRELIVRNAWDVDRRQVVADGNGTFDDDGRSIYLAHTIFTRSMWRRVSEVRDGIRHGQTTVYHKGVLWRTENYSGGKLHGAAILYWDNGRIRSTSEYENGKQVKTESFPKFDNPVPAVLLSVEANADLYEAWNHLRLDEYPSARNLDEIRAELQLPQFLMEVQERNRLGTIKSRYEDWNTFDDSIAYFLTVSPSGEVVETRANGSGTYSSKDWNTYVPLLKKLRFTPGCVRGVL